MRTVPILCFVGSALIACASDDTTGSSAGAGGDEIRGHDAAAAGADTGGSATGGSAMASGGSTAGGGTVGTGGSGAGRGGTAGAASGGAATGGSSSGGAAPTGGSSSGGAVARGGGSTGGSGAVGGADGCTPVLNQADLDTGFESCDDGSKRRRAVVDCPTERTSTTSPCSPVAPTACTADADCTREPNGYCADAHLLSGYCGCYYGCRRDADCGAGEICECGVVVGRCVLATCTTNADCDPGFGCVATVEGTAGSQCQFLGSGPSLYACQTALDECAGDDDCPSSGNDHGVCLLDGDRRACGLACALTP